MSDILSSMLKESSKYMLTQLYHIIGKANYTLCQGLQDIKNICFGARAIV